MKTWIMTLPFVCVVSVAMAQGVESVAGGDNASAMPPAAAAAPQLAANHAQAPAAQKPRRTAARRTGGRGARSLPKGDVRHCLDLNTQLGVIRCSESGKNRKP